MDRIMPSPRDVGHEVWLKRCAGMSRQIALHREPGHRGRDAPKKPDSWANGLGTMGPSRGFDGVGAEGLSLVI